MKFILLLLAGLLSINAFADFVDGELVVKLGPGVDESFLTSKRLGITLKEKVELQAGEVVDTAVEIARAAGLERLWTGHAVSMEGGGAGSSYCHLLHGARLFRHEDLQ